jgi:eukaryotic-like serine/threonine-protein kinase
MKLIGQLNTLESAGLLRLVAVQPELEYLFRHALVQDAAYASLLKQDRKQLHLAVGEALERLYPEQRDEQAATLAYHFERAEVRERAVHYLARAGDRARDGYANAEAIAFYQAAISQIEQALNQAVEQSERWRRKLASLFESLADVIELTGQHEAARRAYDQALAAQAQLARPEWVEQARVYRKIGFVLTVSRQHAEAHQAWDEGERALERFSSVRATPERTSARWREWIEIQVERIWSHYWQFHKEEMERLCEKLMPVMEQYGTPAHRARVLTVLAMMRFQRERVVCSAETLAIAEAALTAARDAGNLGIIFDAQFYVGFLHLWRRELDQAEAQFRPARVLAERIGDAIRLSRVVTYQMLLARMRGQVGETRSHIPQVLELAWVGRMTNYTYTAKACLAWLAWREGDLAEAREQARAGLELLQGPLADYPVKWPALWPLLAVAVAEQKLAEAIETAQALLHPTQMRLPETLTGALEAAIAAGEQRLEDARVQLEHSIKLAQEMGYL